MVYLLNKMNKQKDPLKELVPSLFHLLFFDYLSPCCRCMDLQRLGLATGKALTR